MLQTNFKKIADGINIIEVSSNQYKTNLISLYIKRPLKRDEVTKNAVLPYMLRMGSKNYLTQLEIDKNLQYLYGSSLNVGVTNMGEKQILSFKVLFTNDKYLNEEIQGKVIDMLFDIVFNPFVIGDAFEEKRLQTVKNAQKEALLSRMNDKGAYSMDRAIKFMFEGEPFEIIEEGFIEDLGTIDGKNLYEHYKNILSESEIDIAVTGNVDVGLIDEKIKKFINDRKNLLVFDDYSIKKDIKETKEVQETIDVSQGKLVIGYRTNIEVSDALMVPLFLYSAILGGGADSKLFKNVREKHSLAYSISSSLDILKGALFIRAGIETTDLERAKKLISAEVEAMQTGNISDDEIEKAKKMLVNRIKSASDSAMSVADYIYTLSFYKGINTPDIMIKKILETTREEINEVSKYLKIDTIYFLTSKEVGNE